MTWEPVCEQDKKIIRQQINRHPRNLHGIARRCIYQCPQVSVNYPLPKANEDVAFFPTVFWLTCPEAVRQISRIEDRGFIQVIQEKITGSRELSYGMQDSHKEYIYIRRTLLNSSMLIRLRKSETELVRAVEQVGIGGVSDLQGVKCLHMHYAHYLATRNNPIGELIDKMIALSASKWKCNTCFQSNGSAGVAELADAADLKSAEPKGSCRFEPGPRHHVLQQATRCN